jgi:hypothetical protein
MLLVSPASGSSGWAYTYRIIVATMRSCHCLVLWEDRYLVIRKLNCKDSVNVGVHICIIDVSLEYEISRLSPARF